MKKILFMMLLLLSPFILMADAIDDVPSTGNPKWHYFDYQVKYPGGDTNSGKMRVCASNALVAVSTGRSILYQKFGKCSIKLHIKARGEACEEERSGEILE
jgi:hypothetical protein